MKNKGLHLAAKTAPFTKEQLELKVLLEKHDVNAIDDNGFTPLMYAVESGNLWAVRFLLNNNADVNVISIDGNCALHLVIAHQYYLMLDFLLRRCAHVIDTSLQYKNQNILQHAAQMYTIVDDKDKAFEIFNRIKSFCSSYIAKMDPQNSLSKEFANYSSRSNAYIRYKFINNREVVEIIPKHQFTITSVENDEFDEQESDQLHWLRACLPQFINKVIDDCTRLTTPENAAKNTSRRVMHHFRSE